MKAYWNNVLAGFRKDGYTFSDWAWIIVIASFLGFVVEDIWLLFTKGYANNRNMYLPFLFGYGLAILGVYLFFGTPQDSNGLIHLSASFQGWSRYAFYLLVCFFFVSLAEIILGFSVNRLCGIDYWNYENLPLHFTRYTSFFTSLGFSSFITLFMRFVFRPAMDLVRRFRHPVFRRIGAVLLLLLVADYFASFGAMVANQDFHKVWTITL